MKIPTIKEMVKAGVHFGHAPSKRHPSMDQYIYGVRNNVHIFDLEKTTKKIEEALEFVKETVAGGNQILFVGTKKQAQDIVKEAAKSVDMPYVEKKWLGGTLTNFRVINGLVKKLKKLEEQEQNPNYAEKYTKKERLEFDLQKNKLNIMISGIKDMERMPGALFLVGACDEKTALREAQNKNIPTVAICDTNANSREIDYPVPANDDAIRSIKMITELVVEAIKSGKEEAKLHQENKVAEKPNAGEEGKDEE